MLYRLYHTVGDWEACGDYFYCKELLYDMLWEEIDLQHKRVCCSGFGGPIATVRDDSQMVVVTGSSLRPVIRIFSASGHQLGSIVWDRGRIIDWAWSLELALVIVEDTGQVAVYSMHGEKLREFSMGMAVEQEGISRVCAYGDGLVVLTKQWHMWAVTSVKEPRPFKLADPPILEPPSCIAVLEPRFTLSSGIEVLLAAGPVIWQLDDQTAADHVLSGKPASSTCVLMKLSPDGHFLAMFTSDGRLVVMSSDFTKQLSEFETKADVPPLDISWCGTDAILVYWPEILLLVGPYGDYINWTVADEKLALVPEVDGLRIISNARHELLRKVPGSLVEVFKPGSTSPAAQLWEARELYDGQNARSDKVLRNLGDQLPTAVMTCIEAAGLDLSIPRQKALLRAACYGRAFCATSFPAMAMYNVCHKLRVLNALREPAVGLPLTMTQLEALTMPVVVARLVAYHQWLLAYRIAGTMQPAGAAAGTAQAGAVGRAAPPSSASSTAQEQVLIQWACAKISTPTSQSLADQELKDQLVAKLKACPTIRFAPLAAHAQSVGRRRLAIKLLDEENSCALQVPLLLSLSIGQKGLDRGPAAAADDGSGAGGFGEDEDTLSKALRKAIESGDTDLVHLVLFHIYKHKPLPEFWALVSSRALARNLFIKYCRAKEPELLETILTANNQTVPLADHQLQQLLGQYATAHSRHAANDLALGKLAQGLADCAHKYGLSRDHAFQSRAVSELAQLRREQARLEQDTGQALFVGLSLVDTIATCIRLGHHRHAAALKKLFNITDKRFWWLKARTLSQAHDWEGLDVFASERKSPIGWEPFLELAKKDNAPREVQARIIARMPDSATKAQEYSAIDCPREAAEVAARCKDADLFAKIQSAVSANSPAGLAIAQIKERFQSTFR